MAKSLLAFDVGNSNVKVGLITEGQFVWSAAAPKMHVPSLVQDAAARLPAKNADLQVVLSEVSAPTADRLVSELQRAGMPAPARYRSDGALFNAGWLKAGVLTPETTGVDRLLAAIAGRARAPQRSVLTIDSGSATTVNLTTADGVFRGGAILPGLALMAKALAQGTFALPEIAVTQPPSPLGVSTIAALQAGVYYAQVGGVHTLVEALVANNRDAGFADPAIFLTGGGAPLLRQALNDTWTWAPHLVLEGLAQVAGSPIRVD